MSPSPNLLSRVQRTIEQRRLIHTGDRVLIACSGGPDSMAMLHVLSQLAPRLGITLAVASVDHQLRIEAVQEVAVVEKAAHDLGLPFVALKVQIPDTTSVQSAARAARYAALRSVMEAQKMTRIAVGHTRNDQAETVIERMMRGAGLPGLSAIAPARQDGVIRPMIDVQRKHILDYLQRHRVSFAQDPSNQNPRFKRTRIRCAIMPLLEQEDAGVFEHLSHLADDARAVSQWLNQNADELLQRCQRSATELDAKVFQRGHQAVRRVALRRWLHGVAQLKMSRVQLLAADRAAKHGGEVWLKDGWSLREVDGVLKAIQGDHVVRRPTRSNPRL